MMDFLSEHSGAGEAEQLNGAAVFLLLAREAFGC